MLTVWGALLACVLVHAQQKKVQPCDSGTIVPNVLVHKPTITHAPTLLPAAKTKDMLQKLNPKLRWVVNANGQPENKGKPPGPDTNDPKSRLNPCHDKRVVIRPNIPVGWKPPPCIVKTKVYRPHPPGVSQQALAAAKKAAQQTKAGQKAGSSPGSSSDTNAGAQGPSSSAVARTAQTNKPCAEKTEVVRAVIPHHIHDRVSSATVAVNDMFRIHRLSIPCTEFIKAEPIKVKFDVTAAPVVRLLESKTSGAGLNSDLLKALEIFVRRV